MDTIFSKNKLEKSFLITFIIVTILTIFISSTVITVFFDQKMTQREFEFQKFSLNTSDNIMESLNNKAKEMLVLFDNNNDVRNLFNNGSAELELKSFLIKICEPHIPLKGSPNFVMYLIDYKRELIYTLFYDNYVYRFDQFFDRDIIEFAKTTRFEDKFKPMFRTVPYQNYSYNSNVITYVYFQGSKLSYSNTAIVINFDRKWLEDRLTQECANGESLYFLNLSDKTFLCGSSSATKETADDIAKKIEKSNLIKKNIIFKSPENENKPFLLSYMESPEQYVTIAKTSDYDNIRKPLTSMRLTIILIIVLMIFFGIVAAAILSGRIFSRVDRELKKRYTKPNPFGLKETYNSINTANLIDEETAAIIATDFSTVHQIDQTEELFLLLLVCDRNDSDIINWLSEIDKTISSYFKPYVSEIINSDSLLTVLKSPENSDETEIKLRAFIEALSTAANQPFSAYYSTKGNVSNLINMIYDVKVIYDFKFILKEKSVKSSLDISNMEENSVNVPISILEKISLTIYSGEYNDLLHFIKKNFFERVNDYTLFSIKDTIQMLSNSLQSAFYNVQKSSTLDMSDLIKKSGNLPKCHNVFETEASFTDIILSINDLLSEKNQNILNKQTDYIEKICKLVEENYQDISFSSKTIADRLKLSNIYICRIFKNAKNESLNNYINAYRIEKAAELLITTTLSAQDISKQCGLYNANYFYTLFKKYKSITANEYKKQHMLNK